MHIVPICGFFFGILLSNKEVSDNILERKLCNCQIIFFLMESKFILSGIFSPIIKEILGSFNIFLTGSNGL